MDKVIKKWSNETTADKLSVGDIFVMRDGGIPYKVLEIKEDGDNLGVVFITEDKNHAFETIWSKDLPLYYMGNKFIGEI